ncbi:MAG: hypothetical protein PHC64_06920 [Candidatus Gastranaerophilales bacterium]|nr:hypothetical protein [Candidatus Gastranaerophilales bacterium]
MADPITSIVQSGLFCYRSGEKFEKGHVGRGPVVVGQFVNALKSACKLDGKLGQGAQAAMGVLTKAAGNDKLLEGAGKVAGFAAKNVNPLICVSSGIDVLMSDDPEATLVKNGIALGAMFGAEHLMKKHMADIPKIRGVDKIAKSVIKFSETHAHAKGLPAVLHGAAFVAGSCLAYGAGEKFGKLLLGERGKRETANRKQ